MLSVHDQMILGNILVSLEEKKKKMIDFTTWYARVNTRLFSRTGFFAGDYFTLAVWQEYYEGGMEEEEVVEIAMNF